MRLSFAVPNYNKSKDQVLFAISSLVNQTKSVFEILFIDDGSDDQSFFDEIKKFSPLVKVFARPHLGPGAARNYAIEIARGTHIAFLDSDDVVSPFFVETAECLIEDDPDVLLFGVSHQPQSSRPNVAASVHYSGDDARAFFAHTNWRTGGLEVRSACGKVYSLPFLRGNNLYFPALFQGEDVVFNYKASFFLNSIIALPAFSSYGYAQSAASSSQCFNRDKSLQFQEEAAALLDLVERFKPSKEKAQEAYYDVACEIIPAALKTCFCHPLNQDSFRKRYAGFKRFLKEEKAFAISIKRLDPVVCPTSRKRSTVRLHKMRMHLAIFLYYERKLRWKK